MANAGLLFGTPVYCGNVALPRSHLKHPLISDDCKGIVEHSWLLYQLGVSFDEGSEPVLWHVGGQVVEHAVLAEQGMRPGLDGVGLEIMPRLSPAAPSRVSRTTANALSSSSAAGGLRCGPRPHAEAQILGVAEAGLHCPPLRVELDDLRRGRVTAAGHQAPGLLHALGVHAHADRAVSVASRSLRARPPWPIQSAAGRVVPSTAPTRVLPFRRMT